MDDYEVHDSHDIHDIHVLSDTHIENVDLSTPQKVNRFFARILPPLRHARQPTSLFMAGDMGSPFANSYEWMLSYVSDLYAKSGGFVFLVAGNHEFFGHGKDETMARLKKVCSAWPNVILLSRPEEGGAPFFDIPGTDLRVTGATLWTHVPDDAKDRVSSSTNDVRNIKDWSIDAHNQNHALDGDHIASQIRLGQENKKQMIVVTHHAPSSVGTSHPKYAGDALQCAFSSDFAAIVSTSKKRHVVACWIYGHTHYSGIRVASDGCMMISNQLGYADEKPETTRFNARLCLSMDSVSRFHEKTG